MSEYQYYEFQTIDCPLTPAQQAAMRKLSSRVELSATPVRLIEVTAPYAGSTALQKRLKDK